MNLAPLNDFRLLRTIPYLHWIEGAADYVVARRWSEAGLKEAQKMMNGLGQGTINVGMFAFPKQNCRIPVSYGS